MGCDIHLYMEYKDPTNTAYTSWSNFGRSFYVGREYGLFGYLAGVRGSGPAVVPARGYPEDAGWDTNDDFYYRISDDDGYDGETRYVTLERAKSWGVPILYDKNGKPDRVQCPDNHTPSWLTWSEFTSALVLCELQHRNWLNNEDPDSTPAIKDLYARDLKRFLLRYKAVAATMETFEKAGYITRIVFWFDN